MTVQRKASPMSDVNSQDQSLDGSQNAVENLQPGETPDYPGTVPAYSDTHAAPTPIGQIDGETGNLVTGVIDSTPSPFDPAASHDGGHTTIPSTAPTNPTPDEDTPTADPRTSAAVDILGTGGSAA